MGYRQALDTFVVELDGVPYGVNKGAVLADDHPVVRHDAENGGRLFTPLDAADADPPAKSGPDPDPAETPVKPSGRKPAAKAP